MKNSRRTSKKFFKFYIAEPKENADIDALASRLIGLKNVMEVYITDSIRHSGILIKTRFDESPKDVEGFISKHLDRRYGEVQAIAYRKAR